MSDTPETQEAVERWRQGKINVFDEMARLERERDSLQDQRDFAMVEIERLRKERDEARELARDIYWAGYELRRFARAYANDYDECDGKPAAIQADHAFSEASINVAKVLGEEEAAE